MTVAVVFFLTYFDRDGIPTQSIQFLNPLQGSNGFLNLENNAPN